uniref:MFS domain-containing protein n=1 Tax=Rhabditophanes sp. KR3021 TaxID=114890 RepID=A0AC35TPJ1_9BILA
MSTGSLTKNEKQRRRIFILILTCLYYSYERWTQTLTPFIQWGLRPVPDLYGMLTLNSIGFGAMVIGTFVSVFMIESIGGKKTAIVCTVVVSIYQMILPKVGSTYGFAGVQLLLLFNCMPTIIDVLISSLMGEFADLNEVTAIITQQNVPYSIALALGPYFAIQSLFILSPNIETSQFACGILHLISIGLVVSFMPGDNQERTKTYQSANLSTYFELLRNQNVSIILLLVALIYGPSSCYDQVIRSQLSTHMLITPSDMCKLALLVGISALLTSLFILPYLQRRLGPQTILQLSATLLAMSYLFLSQVTTFEKYLIGCPFQAIASSMAVGSLSAQLMTAVPKIHFAKAAALNRVVQLASMAITPILTGFYIEESEIALLCYVASLLTILSIPIVHRYGNFMKIHTMNLPTRARMD